MNNINKEIPLLITRKIYVLPGTSISLTFKEEYSLNVFNYILKNKLKKQILIISQKKINENLKDISNVYKIGVIANFKIISRNKENNSLIVEFFSIERIKIIKIEEKENILLTYNFEFLKDKKLTLLQRKKLSESFLSKLKIINKELYSKVELKIFKTPEINGFIYIILNSYPIEKSYIKQKSLETNSVIERFALLEDFDKFKKSDFLDLMKIVDIQIDEIVKNTLSEQQRIFLLKEKLKIIKKQLGEYDGKKNTVSLYLKRLSNEPFPKYIKERMEEEISKLQTLHPSSGEAGVVKNYIDWVMSLPWYQESEDNKDLKKVKKILDLNHYGLKKPKEVIIEHLATNIFANKIFGQIICLIGPPGVGKTSLGFSIADALGKRFARISLGGVKDEAEIRGHRKTYLGSMPGKIIRTIKKTGTKNPLILIDEIDKLSSDYRGDPTSAMLEVLDPEQNSTFSDHYIEEPFDLSKVTFIATANYEYAIPTVLRDRMEIIYLSSYTELEKIEIAKKHLIPKIFEELNLGLNTIEFEISGILEIIKYYTREAGVRELKRKINKICRKIIVKLLFKKVNEKIVINSKNIEKYLGKKIFEHTLKNKNDEIGVVTGLAYTEYGGDILPIETTNFNGTGKLILTGKLGEVMRESANIALDFIKSNSKKFKINNKIFSLNDIHIHVPEGAVPKDGPSAGITLTTALISLFKNKKISNNIAMTGEITLTGKILPIGGLKEKAISAARSEIQTIIIPKENQKDVKKIPKEVLDKLEIIFVSDYFEVFEYFFK